MTKTLQLRSARSLKFIFNCLKTSHHTYMRTLWLAAPCLGTGSTDALYGRLYGLGKHSKICLGLYCPGHNFRLDYPIPNPFYVDN